MKTILAVLLLCALPFGQTTTTQDADALKAQYSTCEKHHIPADKCTPEIYRQLKEKDNAPLDLTTAAALKAVMEYQAALKNLDSMELRMAYVTEKGDVCLEIGSQNGMGGMSVSRVVHTSKGKWLDEGGALGSNSADLERMKGTGYHVDRWPNFCYKMKFGGGKGPMFPGTDVTEKVNQALKRSSQ
jgi:hypothetical protein